MSDQEAARRQAEEDHRRNQQTQIATEQQISSSVVREAYNAELAYRRSQSGNN
ncbi:hypothetical protein [Stappia indica]|uniref:hypothetical protein n=1 Tax=Stappia indica TaxID=538381 RepID=UPI0014955A1B|nr:hypothetical protein [Stappia indica]